MRVFEGLNEEPMGGSNVQCPVLHEELRKIAGDLMAARRRLTEIARTLPGSEDEALRSLIEGIVNDSIAAAINGLLEASEA